MIALIGLLLFGVVALIFVSAALSPLESLSWWAWSGSKPKSPEELEEAAEAQAADEPEEDFYLVYLSGIGAISGTSIPDEEYPFIHGLEARLTNGKVISDIYPYSVTNNGLTGQRTFARIWRWVEKLRLKNPNSALAMIVNLRNIFQLFVSADRRYGPIYNLGIANEILRGLLRHGYRPTRRKPIVLLGWSGGGQIAIGSVTFLAPYTDALYEVSVGGMLSDDIGFDKITHLWHLYGEKDKLQALGHTLFAGRWQLLPQSPWNRAMRAGKIDMIPLGPFNHNGKGNYFDMESQIPDDPQGRTYGEKTLDTIEDVLTKAGLLKAAPAATSPQSATAAQPAAPVTADEDAAAA